MPFQAPMSAVLALFALTLGQPGTPLAAQRGGQRQAAPQTAVDVAADPYTAADATRMEALGYVSFAPIPVGSYYSSADIDELVGPGRMLWLETEHFVLGLPNAPYRLGTERRQRDKIGGELTALRSVLPGVDPGANVLDPWLRMHLLAQRCERVYADMQDFLGVTDGDFPQKANQVRAGPAFMGIGPYLGTKRKFAVLILPSAADIGRYSAKYLDRLYLCPKRYNHGWGNGISFVTAPDLDGGLHDDTVMHCHIVYSLVQNLLDGYRHWCHDTPVWFKTGIAQMALRKIDPRFPNFDKPQDGRDAGRNRGRLGEDWEKIARNLAIHGRGTPMAEMAGYRDYDAFQHHDFILAWSRVAFLMEHHGEAACRNFWHRMKDPFGVPQEQLRWDQVLARQSEALRDMFGYESFEALDTAWRAHARTAK